MGQPRVLLISYYFAPQNAIGAVRPAKLAKYLTRLGCQVTVLCGAGMNGAVDPTLERDMNQMGDVRVLREWNPLRRIKARKALSSSAATQPDDTATQPGSAAAQPNPSPSALVIPAGSPAHPGLAHRLADAAYLFLWLLSDRSFQHKAKRELKKLTGPYDAVFSSYAPLSVHAVARAAKQRGLCKRWIADFRDEVGVSFRWQQGYQRRYLRMVRKEADAITAVSDGFLSMMAFGDVGRVLSNGFDREDIRGLSPIPDQAPGFRAVYCGHIREGRHQVKNRDIRPVFRAMKRLLEEGVLEAPQLVYAGDESAEFRAYAEECGLGAYVEDHGKVSRDMALALEKGADALVMASWHMTGQTGILTGKLFEYMMMDKPILCCMSGDLTGSGVKRVLTETGMGFCCEEAAGTADEEALTAFLRELLLRRRQGLPPLPGKQPEEVEKYAYPHLAHTLIEWIQETTR